jgi:hypothetical protein
LNLQWHNSLKIWYLSHIKFKTYKIKFH